MFFLSSGFRASQTIDLLGTDGIPIKTEQQTEKFFALPKFHRGAFCQFPFRWIYYCHNSKSTGEETGKTHLCELLCHCVCLLWHYRLWSFQGRDTKLERFLQKNQL